MGIAVTATTAVQAQTTGTVKAEQTEHARLLANLQSEEILDANTASVSKAAVRNILANNPVFADLAEREPGYADDLATRLQPMMRAWSLESLDKARPRQVALLAETLTAQEAGRLADFYATPLGQRIVVGMAKGIDYSASVNPENPGQPLSSENVQKDVQAASRRMAAEATFTPEEQVRLLKIIADPAFTKLSKIAPQMTNLVVEAENRPIPPETQAAMAKVLVDSLADYGITAG